MKKDIRNRLKKNIEESITEYFVNELGFNKDEIESINIKTPTSNLENSENHLTGEINRSA